MQVLTASAFIYVVCSITLTVAFPTAKSKPYKLGTNSFFLGTVEGKTYIIDSTRRNWTEAEKFCKESGLRLGTITSTAQKDFLQSKYQNPPEFVYEHWTAGRDAQTLQQLVWHYNESPVDSLLSVRGFDAGIQTCLAYDALAGSHYDLEKCSSLYPVLCESG